MLREPVIVVEQDTVPIVRMVAILLENARQYTNLATMMSELNGSLTLQSSTDTQAVSIQFNAGEIILGKGISNTASVSAEINFNSPISIGPDTSLDGAAEHPDFTQQIRTIFAPQSSGWREAGQRFWMLYGDREGLPQALRAECTDDGQDLVLGEGTIQMHFIGSMNALAEIFTCATMPITSVITGKICALGDLKYLSTLSGVYFDRITGELP